MTVYSWLILGLWLMLLVTWVVSAASAKRSAAGGWRWRREIALRVAILVVVLVAMRLSNFSQIWPVLRPYAIISSPIAGFIGTVLCAIGVGLAIFARVHLGRNWGMPMSRKEDPELVTTGPYAAVRHPIYSGLLLAMLGSAIGQSIYWVLPLIVSGPYFIYSAWREEKLMRELFPEQYPAYLRRTKMLLPYLL